MTDQNMPELSLQLPTAPNAPAAEVGSIQQEPAAKPAEPAPAYDDSMLSDAERRAIDTFIAKLDLTNNDHVLLFGSEAQKKASAFADSALSAVKTQETGEVGTMLIDLVQQLKHFEGEADGKPTTLLGRIGSLFSKPIDQIERMKASYAKVSVNVESIASSLEGYQAQLLKDVAMFERLYDENTGYIRELTLYIIAGEKYLHQVRTTTLAELYAEARKSGDAMDAQKAKDLEAQCDRFEKKLHDLKLTRQVAIQMAPQIRLIQSSNQIMAEKIQTSLVNTIPLWKSQMVLALGLAHTENAMKAQRAVTDLTNDLLTKNAEKLHMATVETAKEAERGMVDIETLKHTNKLLIDTMDEVLEIQQQGKEKRRAAEQELATIEGELRAKIMEMR